MKNNPGTHHSSFISKLNQLCSDSIILANGCDHKKLGTPRTRIARTGQNDLVLERVGKDAAITIKITQQLGEVEIAVFDGFFFSEDAKSKSALTVPLDDNSERSAREVHGRLGSLFSQSSMDMAILKEYIVHNYELV